MIIVFDNGVSVGDIYRYRTGAEFRVVSRVVSSEGDFITLRIHRNRGVLVYGAAGSGAAEIPDYPVRQLHDARYWTRVL